MEVFRFKPFQQYSRLIMVAIVVHSARVTAEDGDVTPAVSVGSRVEEAPDLKSAKAFLLARPSGVYTCARAVPNENELRLVRWPFHLTRLTQGLAREQGKQCAEQLVNTLQEATTLVVKTALQAVHERPSERGGDAMITVLWSQDANDSGKIEIRIDVHICPMPQVKALSANVLVNGNARDKADCKHSRWIADRVPLEHHTSQVAATQGLEIHESILSSSTGDGDRLLLEGLITNFFVVKDGCVYTSDEAVLPGSKREMVLLACAALGVPVVLQAPRLSEMATWQAAFLTSAVRIVIPIARVLWHEGHDASAAIHAFELDPQAVETQLLIPLREQIHQLWR